MSKTLLDEKNRKLILVFPLLCVFLVGCSKPKLKSDKSSSPPATAESYVEEIPAVSTESLRVLGALGYFDRAAADNVEDRNVTKDIDGTFEGLNLYGSRHRARALLVDMKGKVLHSWSVDPPKPPWMHMELVQNGDLVVISKGQYAARVDWNSKILWKRSLGAHHDFTMDKEGRVWVLTRRTKDATFEGQQIPVLADSIAILSPDGELIREIPLLPLLRRFVPKSRIRRILGRVASGRPMRRPVLENTLADLTHTNSIVILDREIPDVAPAGSVLLSVREINRIVILDAKLRRVLWHWGENELQEQHHATLVDNGQIMVFDNGIKRKQSRVLEIKPVTGKIVWSYTAPDFYTRLRGAAQKLENGNVLITESDKGHAFEVSRQGKVVWEFWNPDVYEKENPTRAVIYRLTRYGETYLEPQSLLSNLK